MDLDSATESAVHCLPGRPWAPHWYPEEALEWDPRTDPDAPFNRSVVPLAPRVQDERLAARPEARAGEGRICSGAAFGGTANTPAQGSATAGYYAFGYWQYVDTLIYWGGIASGGLIVAPAAPVTDAAHRNGVKVYGNVYFPEEGYGDRVEWLRQFVHRTADGRYPMAERLVDIARYYRFDGWFLNQESPGDAALARGFQGWMKHLRARGGGEVECMWYDSMVDTGGISWQGALNERNLMFFRDGDDPVADSIFLDYRWGSADLETSRKHAGPGRYYDIGAGLQVQDGKFPAEETCDSALPATGHLTSVALYRPEWTPEIRESPETFHGKELEFWATGNESWPGFSHYIAEFTSVLDMPFVTNFNAGHGLAYYAAGRRVSDTPWNNMSLQDVLPTYRTQWVPRGSQGAGQPFATALDLTDAYEGGSSVRLRGALAAGVAFDQHLYQCRVVTTADAVVILVAKSPAPADATVQLLLTTSDGDVLTDTAVDFDTRPDVAWTRLTARVPTALAGKTLVRLGVRVTASAMLLDHSLSLGQLSLLATAPPEKPEKVTYPEPPKEVQVQSWRVAIGGDAVDARPYRTARLRWKPLDQVYHPVHHYEVYRRDGAGNLVLLAATPNSVCFVPEVTREGDEPGTTLYVASVTADGRRSPERHGWTTTEVAWP